MFTNVERAVRSLRRRRQWTQMALGGRAGVSREMVSRIERGEVAGMTIGSLEHVAAALGATLLVQLRWQGANLDRLMDAAHARLQQDVASWLTAIGWVVHVEVSFNHYGDRGRVDIVAFHPTLRLMLIIEIKSALGDIQETLGRLDVKARLGRVIAGELGWSQVTAVVPALVITDSRAVRRQIAAHEALFERYSMRGRKAAAWLRRPRGTAPAGILWFRSRPDSHATTTRRRGERRERPDAPVSMNPGGSGRTLTARCAPGVNPDDAAWAMKLGAPSYSPTDSPTYSPRNSRVRFWKW